MGFTGHVENPGCYPKNRKLGGHLRVINQSGPRSEVQVKVITLMELLNTARETREEMRRPQGGDHCIWWTRVCDEDGPG